MSDPYLLGGGGVKDFLESYGFQGERRVISRRQQPFPPPLSTAIERGGKDHKNKIIETTKILRLPLSD